MTSPLLLERAGPVATLTLNRPGALNTLDLAMMDALVDATAECAADDALRVVVVRGAGRHFMAGGDIQTFATGLDRPGDERTADFVKIIERVHVAIEQPAPDAAPGRLRRAGRRRRLRSVADERLRSRRRGRRCLFHVGLPQHRDRRRTAAGPGRCRAWSAAGGRPRS